MTHETVPMNRRVYLVVQPSRSTGQVKFRMTARPPDYRTPAAVLLSRGVLPMGDDVEVAVISDASVNPELRGKDGLSAYQVAREKGYGGTETQWLATLVGAAGASAYEIARQEGYGGTRAQWLATLAGAAGKDGTNGRDGINGTNGKDRTAGKDAASLLGSVVLAESNLLNIAAGVRRRVIATAFDLPIGAPILLMPKTLTPLGYIVQAAWATKVRELTVDLTTPAITVLGGYSIDCWIQRLNT